MLTRKGLSAGSKGSSETEAMNSCQQPHTQQTLRPDTQPSAQPDHPFSVEDVREALGYDRNDTNVTVTIKRADRLEDRDPMASVFASIFGGVTDAVTDEDGVEDVMLTSVINEVLDEVERAVAMHGPMQSPREGYAILKEEVDELWDAIKANNGHNAEARKEAIQVAAMAIRYLLDIDPD